MSDTPLKLDEAIANYAGRMSDVQKVELLTLALSMLLDAYNKFDSAVDSHGHESVSAEVTSDYLAQMAANAQIALTTTSTEL